MSVTIRPIFEGVGLGLGVPLDPFIMGRNAMHIEQRYAPEPVSQLTISPRQVMVGESVVGSPHALVWTPWTDA